MSGLLVSLQGAVAQGVLWGIMVLGVYITFRLMDIADMTVDGSFALGACVCAVLVVNKGVNPVLALLVAAAAGVVVLFIFAVQVVAFVKVFFVDKVQE